jgi:DNA-binding CsgD family transcriptional regulator
MTTAMASDPASRVHTLSARELEMLRLVGGGLTNSEIGRLLYLSERTVERHLANAYTRAAAAVAVARG